MPSPSLIDQISRRLGRRVQAMTPLSGGSVGDVYRLDFNDGEAAVAKLGTAASGLDIEGRMLIHLATQGGLAVPEVWQADPDLLVMSHLDAGGPQSPAAEEQVAEAIANLHQMSWTQFGHSEDTLIGGLHQPNPPTESWLAFYRDQRLLFMADEARKAGRLSTDFRLRLDTFCTRLPALITEPPGPQLVHGDLWGGNILFGQHGLSGFIDPAIYYGHGEMDLAFATLFHSLGDAFFNRYHEINPIPPGFFEERRDIYNLYPLLVHIRLFGGSYVDDFSRILRKFDC